MCRGLALGIDKKLNIVCKGLSRHSLTFGKNEDD
jgi:hypothetical protein